MWWLIVVGIILILAALYLILNQSEPGYSNSQIERYPPQSQGVIMYREDGTDQFNEALIQQELANLANTPDMFYQYARQLRQRFTKYNQLKIIEKWTSYYEKGASLVEANTKLKQAQKDNQRVDLEDEVEQAKLNADKEEHLTRAVKAQHKRAQIGKRTHPPEKSEEDLKMEASRDYEKRTIRYRVETTILKNVTTLAEIQRIEVEQTARILSERSLTPQQQQDQLLQLRRDCDEAKKKLNADIRPYEDD